MNEAIFNRETVRAIRESRGWAYNIPDMPARFTPDKPCDVIAMYEGRGVLIECKMLKGYQAFGKRHIRPSQIREMDKALEAGTRAFLFVNIRKTAKPRLNRIIILEWSEVRERIMSEVSYKKPEMESFDYIEGAYGTYELGGFREYVLCGTTWNNPYLI